jgi:acetylornithine deacetylase/succinyl-diaminopimelate desuccinylase-like protein
LRIGARGELLKEMPPATARTAQTHGALSVAHHRLRVRDDGIVRTQIALTQIAAPTGAERARGAWVAQRFRELGLSGVRTDDAGNVVGRRPGTASGAPVVVCAHLDTVFPHDTDLRVRRDGARIVAPGIGDNGRGLAAMLALAEELDGVTLRTRRPVDFVATVGEEGLGDLRGAKHFFAALDETPTAAIALDGAGDERVVHRALGSRRYRVSFRGPGGHSWAAYGVPNAVHAAARAAARLAQLTLPSAPRTTLSVGRIGGGMSVNAIPEEGWLEIDLRSTSPRALEKYDAEIRAIATRAAHEENESRAPGTQPLRHAIEVIGDRPCGETPAEHPLVRSAVEATTLSGRDAELATASTDANVPISLGIPAIAIGAGGRGGDAHTPGEWYDNVDGWLGVARALTIVVSSAGLP